MKSINILFISILFLLITNNIIPQDIELVPLEKAEKLALYFANQKWPEKEFQVYDYRVYYNTDLLTPAVYIFALYYGKPTPPQKQNLYDETKVKSLEYQNTLNILNEITDNTEKALLSNNLELISKELLRSEQFITITIAANKSLPPFIECRGGLPDFILNDQFIQSEKIKYDLRFLQSNDIIPVYFAPALYGNVILSENRAIIYDWNRKSYEIEGANLRFYFGDKDVSNSSENLEKINNIKEQWLVMNDIETLNKTGIPSNSESTSVIIAGVPQYLQNKFGSGTCAPTAALETLAYWDNNGYENLIDYTTAVSELYTPGIFESAENLKTAMNWSSAGVHMWDEAPGIKNFCNNSEYKNNLNFNTDFIYAPTFNGAIKTSINESRPFSWAIWGDLIFEDGSGSWIGAHTMTAFGYEEYQNPDTRILVVYLHWYSGETSYINYDAGFRLREYMVKIIPGGSDNVPPVCQVLHPNTNNTFTGPFFVDVSAQDLSKIWLVEYQYSLNQINWYNFPGQYIKYATAPETNFSLMFFPDQANIIYETNVKVRARAKDNWGNWSAWDESDQPFTIDLRGPIPTTISLTATLNPTTCNTNQSVNVSGSAVYNNGNPVQSGTVIIEIPGFNTWTAYLVNGNYNTNIYAPPNTGTYTVKVTVTDGTLSNFVNRTLNVTTGGSGSGYTFYRSTICLDVMPGNPYDPINETQWIRSNDNYVFSWVHLTNIGNTRLRVRWEWNAPDGEQYIHTGDWTDLGPWDWWKEWSWLPVQGYGVAPGIWNVNISIQKWGESSFTYHKTDYFTVSYNLTEHMMAEDIGGPPNYLPINPKNIFYQNDTKALTWMNLDDVSEGLEVKWNYYEPNGSQYDSYTHLTNDPGSGNYYGWYRLGGWTLINGYSAMTKTGDWRIDVLIKNNSGIWRHMYTDHFTLKESPNIAPFVQTGTPSTMFEGQVIQIPINVSDNGYLKKVVFHWNDGTDKSITLADNINNNTFSSQVSIGPYLENTQITYYAKALDNSNNQATSIQQTFTVLDTDTLGPVISNFQILEHNGNNNGIIEPDEQIIISWELYDPSGIGEVILLVNDSLMNVVNNTYSIIGPYSVGTHSVMLFASDNDISPATSSYYSDFTVNSQLSPAEVYVSPLFLSFNIALGSTDESELTISNIAAAGSQSLTWQLFESNDQKVILFVGADDGDASYIRNYLSALPNISIADYYSARYSTPALSQLQGYDVVIAYSNFNFFDKVAMGNILADYVDSGGKVILTQYSNQGTMLQGRIIEENYSAFNSGNVDFATLTLGNYNASHPIMNNVNALSEFNPSLVTLATGAELVAEYVNQRPLVATKGNSVVCINAFFGSNHLWTGDMGLLLYNTIVWFDNISDVPWISASITSGIVPAQSNQITDIMVNTSGLSVGTYDCKLIISSNDINNPQVKIPVTLNVLSTNHQPTLIWTAEPGYEADGVNPDEGGSSTTFTFRVKYSDADGDAPLSGYPKIHIKKSGTPITNSPFTMIQANLDSFTTGRIYTFNISSLPVGNDYTYNFEAYDINGSIAVGQATIEQFGPNVLAPTGQFTLQPIGLNDVFSGSVGWGDYDNDGYLDLLLTGTGDMLGPVPITNLYHNEGNSTFTLQSLVNLINVTNSSIVWGDYDNDGNLDILLTGHDWTNRIAKIYRNEGNNIFTEQTQIELTGVTESSVAWGDYDNDGYLDILLSGYNGSGDISIVYRNEGNNTFTNQSIVNLTNISSGSVTWGDYNNDGYLDILLTGSMSGSKIFRNTGSGQFEEQTSINLVGVRSSSGAWGDYDNDGYLDILITGYTDSGRVSKIYRNNGDNTFSEVTSTSLTGVSNGTAIWGDYDNDGYLDIILSGNISNYSLESITKIYKNIGDDIFSEQSSISLINVGGSSIEWGDYDNDGDLDLILTGFTNNGSPVSRIYRNNNTTPNTLPSAPTNLTSTIIGQWATLSWNKSTDYETPQNGLTYNLRIGTTPGGCEIMSPMSDPLTGKRKIVAMGNTNHNNNWTIKGLSPGTYYWSVQAIDNAFAGSPFSNEEQFAVLSSCQPEWPFVSGTGSNATIAVPLSANPQLCDGLLQPGDVIGVFFTRNDSLICAGYSFWTGTGNIAITAWGNNPQTPVKDGFAPGELIKFKIWNSAECSEYMANVSYTQGDGYYYPDGMYVLESMNAVCTITQTINLITGWSMISSYVEPIEPHLDTVMHAVKTNMELMKNGKGKVYWPKFGINDILNWNVIDGYQIFMHQADTLNIIGLKVDNQTKPIPLDQGWNLVSYLLDCPIDIEIALASINSYLVIAKNGAGQVYWPEFSINYIGNMLPGQGYQLYVSSACTLIYPNCPPLVAKSIRGGEEETEVQGAVIKKQTLSHYANAQKNTGGNATMVVSSAVFEEGDEVGVFSSSGILVGSGLVESGRAVISIWSDNTMTEQTDGAKDGEELYLNLWKKNTKEEINLKITRLTEVLSGSIQTEKLQYQTDGLYVVEAEEEIQIPATYMLEQNYPNPFNPSTVIRYGIPNDGRVRLEIYDVIGQVVEVLVEEEQKAGYYEINYTNLKLSSGVYFYRLQTGDFVQTKKMLLIK